MAIHGSIKTFNAKVDDWTTYAERLKHYLIANGVTEQEKKRSILLTVCGTTTYKLLRSLVGKDNLDTTSYDDLVKLLTSHYNPQPSAIVQRFHFNTRVRDRGESIAEFVATLRDLALHCDYGDKLSEMLRDRLVCGVNHKGIQRKLLAQSDLTYEKAFALAQSVEASDRDAKVLEKQHSTDVEKQQTSSPPLMSTTTTTASEEVHYSTTSRKGTEHLPPVSCYRCGGAHLAPQCKHKDAICRCCGKKGHFARVCRSRGTQGTPGKPKHQEQGKKTVKSTHYMDQESSAEQSTDEEHDLFCLTSAQSEPYQLDVVLNDVPVKMELDTGASVLVLNKATYDSIRQQTFTAPFQPVESNLRTYTGERIQVLGTTKVKARYGEKELYLPIHVVDGSGPNLMGRDWLGHFEVNLKSINVVEHHSQLEAILDKHSEVFRDELGCLKGMPVKLLVHDGVKPKFFKPRPIPLLLREKVEEELENLQAKGIISPVQFSHWAAPIVPVLKKNGKMRLYGDYKITINQAAPTEIYPLPRAEELHANLARGKCFTKLDMSNAYLQLPLDDDSKQYVTVNTHEGLFQYNRLPFGISSAPAIFQRHMKTLLQGLKGVAVYIDDILVTGPTLEEHLQNLEKVLEKLQSAGLRLNKEKCFFLRPSIDYLGHVIDQDGIHPTQEKVTAIKEALRPKNVTELRSFLGLVNYYAKFLPNLSTKLFPLYILLNKKPLVPRMPYKEIHCSSITTQQSHWYWLATPLHMGLARSCRRSAGEANHVHFQDIDPS